ncbi:MAG: hypothetical protein CBC89_03950, partial [Euryarchaeota archaeon TMED129]
MVLHLNIYVQFTKKIIFINTILYQNRTKGYLSLTRGTDMADDAVNALIPVAAVVHIALGVMALMLVRRTIEREWNEIYAGYVISWMMIVLGLEYTFATLIDLKIDNFTDQDMINGAYADLFSSSYKYSEQALNSIFIGLSLILPLIYPYPILQKDNAV